MVGASQDPACSSCLKGVPPKQKSKAKKSPNKRWGKCGDEKLDILISIGPIGS